MLQNNIKTNKLQYKMCLTNISGVHFTCAMGAMVVFVFVGFLISHVCNGQDFIGS